MNLCYEIASRLYKLKNASNRNQNEYDTRSKDYENYWKWQFDFSAPYFERYYPGLYKQLPGKRILDIGCGLGGRTCYLATKANIEIIGIDINQPEIELANRMAHNKLEKKDLDKIRFLKIDENEPLNIGLFDIAILCDTLEHVKDPVKTLNFAHSLLNKGGLLYFNTIGWYSYEGFHAIDIIPIPFAHVFFSDRTILDAIRMIVSKPYYIPNVWDSNPPVTRYLGITDLSNRPGEYLNKITISKIRKVVKDSDFHGGQVSVMGFSWSRFPILRCLNFLTHIPYIQEFYHSACLGRCEKRDDNE